MSTTVSEVKISDFRDNSGKFYVGMTKEEASKLKNGIFNNYQEDFKEIDKDRNGVLDSDEMLTKICEDAKSKNKEAKISFYSFLFWGVASRLYKNPRSRNGSLFGAIVVGLMSLSENLKARKLEKRANMMNKLIHENKTNESDL